ncbi:PREDICTED: uncharacterized protein LOC108799130, partial [Nanorana parkeri]|uniref:uncharacterized protein LOC108799130 n=1 Tax=Nanorana parkeri TaxID=125878 RepID=UPI000854ACC1
MESAFLELYQQFKMLQAVCSQQAQLLQRLISKDANIAEMPVTRPIQCTDAGDQISSQSPLFGQTGTEALSVETTKSMTEDLYQPLKTKDKSAFSFDCDIRLPPNKDQYNVLASKDDKSGLAKSMSHTDVSLDETEINCNFALFIKTYAPTFPKVPGVGDQTIPAMSDMNFLTMDPDTTLNLSNVDEELCFLHSRDMSRVALLEPKINNFSVVRGPAQ